MCVDKEHGGRRCPNDTSASRRQRRKASQVRGSFADRSPASTGNALTSHHITSSLFSEQVAEVKALIASVPPEGSTRSEHDMFVEQKITELGMSLGQEAEKRAGFDAEQLKQAIADLRDLHAPVRVRKKANEAAMIAVEDKIYDYTQKRGLEPVTHVKQVARRANEFTDEEGQALAAEAQEVAAEFDAVGKLQDETEELYNSERLRLRQEARRKLTAAYQSLIAEIRPVGGPAVFAEDSDPDAVALMEATVAKHYPSEWLQHHNNSGPVTVTSVTGTANYSPDVFSESEDDGVQKTRVHEFSYTMDANDEGSKAILKTLRETFPEAEVTVYSVSHFYGQEVYFKTAKDELYDAQVHGVLSESDLKDAGWEYRPSITSLYSIGNDPSQTQDENVAALKAPVWVRQETTTRKRVKVLAVNTDETISEFVRKGVKSSVADSKEGVAYHEFGHRMEDVMPDDKLTRYERAFLKRRSGKNDENFNEQMTVARLEDELYHEGGFVFKYTGKAYANSKYCEVFTTGIQALYSGEFGGLVGNSHSSHYGTDADHRGFVLGTLATL